MLLSVRPEGMQQPTNMFRRLTLSGGIHFTQGDVFPGGDADKDPKIWLIIFEPGHVDASRSEELAKDDEGGDISSGSEEQWVVPPKYLLYMCNSDGSLPDPVLVNEILAEKVFIATRSVAQAVAIGEIEQSLRDDLPPDEVKDFKVPGELLAAVMKQDAEQLPQKPNGQSQAVTGA